MGLLVPMIAAATCGANERLRSVHDAFLVKSLYFGCRQPIVRRMGHLLSRDRRRAAQMLPGVTTFRTTENSDRHASDVYPNTASPTRAA